MLHITERKFTYKAQKYAVNYKAYRWDMPPSFIFNQTLSESSCLRHTHYLQYFMIFL